jgi:hypothetical protein
MCPLDECIFSSGALHRYDKRIEALPRRPNDFEITTIHANYIIGNEKQQMMKSRGLWLATQGTVTGATRYWDGVCSKLTSNHTFNAWPIPFVDDAAVKVPGSREIYLISNGTKCRNPARFRELYHQNFEDVITITFNEFNSIPTCPGGIVS